MSDSPIRNVIFDLDGTLVDSLADLADAMNHVLAEDGLPEHDLQAYSVFIGEGARNLVWRALPESERDATDAWLRRFRRRYEGHMLDRSGLYDGVSEMLDEVVAAGMRVAVLSNKPHALTAAIGAEVLAPWPFVEILGDREGLPRKPDPGTTLALMDRMGAKPEKTAFVGDTKTDMATAVGAGVRGVGVSWGFRSVEELWAHGASAVIDHPRELLGALV